MPYYDYKCENCGNIQELFTHMDEMADCPECGKPMKRLFHARFGINMGVGAYGYYDENLETYIESNRHKREVIRKKGVTPKGETPKEGQSWI